MTETELKGLIKRSLGAPFLKVELTEEHLDDVINETREWFTAFWGCQKTLAVNIPAGAGEIVLPEEAGVDEVTNAWFDNRVFPSPTFEEEDIFTPVAFEFIGAGVFESVLPFSGLVQQLQSIEQAGRILSSNITWEFEHKTNIFRIAPVESRQLMAVLEIITTNYNLDELDSQASHFFKEWAMAQAKETLGRIRSKFDSYPTAGGDRSLDGRELLQEARDEKQRIKEEAAQIQLPMHFITG